MHEPAYHLMVEGIVGTLHTPRELRHFIKEVASREHGIGMTIIVGPTCIGAKNHLTTYAIIAESHIIVNEFPSGRWTLDVFSCLPFKPSVPVDLARTLLDLQDGYVMRLLPRTGVGV